MGKSFSRRRALSTMGAVGLLGISGCNRLTGPRTELAGIQVLNPYAGSVRVDVRVSQAGGAIIEETLSVVQGDGAEALPCSWDRDGEEPVIEVRLAGADAWERLDLAETDEETVLVQVIARPEVGVQFLTVSRDDEFFVDVCAQEE